ncbi:MAG: alpha/beta fold hydrolase, partial [Planctomycetes bacterium]|nr:alpha/beta fold hydrolase [Planctomycetota bacterium]
VEALQKDYRLLVPDLRGFGQTSGFTGTPTLEQMAEDVEFLLLKLGITEPVVLAGLSMGGYVAFTFASKYPYRLGGLVLADTRAEPDNAEGKANRDRMITFTETHTAREVIDQMLPRLVGPETLAGRPEVMEEIRRLASGQAPAGIIGALRAMRDRPDATPLLGQIPVPTLVIVGNDDLLTPPNLAQDMAKTIPHARLATIPGAGHLSNLEQPDLFTEAVRSFLQSLP